MDIQPFPPCDHSAKPIPRPEPKPPQGSPITIVGDQVAVTIAKGSQTGFVRLGDPGSEASELNGLEMLWRVRPHRVSQAHVQAKAGTAEVRWVGGTWSTGVAAKDDSDVTVKTGQVSAPGAVLIPGEISVRAVGKTEKGAAHAIASGTVAIPLEDLPEGSVAAATLSGYTLDTRPSHAEGTTLGGMEVRLTNPRIEGSELRFDFVAGMEARATPDRGKQHLQDGFQVDLRIGFTAWVLPGGAVKEAGASQSGTQPCTMRWGKVGMDAQSQVIEVQGRPGLAGGHLGLTGFKLGVGTDGRYGGRYVRGLGFGVEPVAYDARTGTATGKVTAAYTNAGEIGRRTPYAIELDTVLIQSPAAIPYRPSETKTTGMP